MTATNPLEPSDGREGVDPRPWYQKKRYGIPLAVFALLVLLIAVVPASDDTTQTAAIGPAETVTEVVTETVTETATETVTETATETVTETVTERPTGQLNNLRRRLRQRDQTIRQLRQRIRSLEDEVAAAPEPDSGGNCHPSYQPCVPIASDVDCAGGSGDGPEYTGQVTVVGPDEYGLDSDGDGIGCE